MGMYTQIHYGAQLKKDVPDNVIAVLKFMLGEADEKPTLPEHPLFALPRWSHMLQCDSYYFDYKTTHLLKFDEIAQQWYFNVTSNLKNYDGEIESFVAWLAPYVDKMPGDFLGYSRYEEDETPTLLWHEEAQAVDAVDPVAGSSNAGAEAAYEIADEMLKAREAK